MARRNSTLTILLNLTILNTLLLFLLLLLLHPTHAHPQASPGDGSLQPNLAAPTPSTAQLSPPLLLQRDDTDTEDGSSSGGGGGNSGDGDPLRTAPSSPHRPTRPSASPAWATARRPSTRATPSAARSTAAGTTPSSRPPTPRPRGVAGALPARGPSWRPWGAWLACLRWA
ncbi:hypothetical protein ACCO45_000146 [Purpureocillium lilacinum]|uniref:Uncharacterized protein n=1 Tax=Purpureocillium lilacinum TaxID=33203 RepID=A0ACC4E3E7_PURLI